MVWCQELKGKSFSSGFYIVISNVGNVNSFVIRHYFDSDRERKSHFFHLVVLVMLRLNVAKTKFMIVGFRQRLQTQAEVTIQPSRARKQITKLHCKSNYQV